MVRPRAAGLAQTPEKSAAIGMPVSAAGPSAHVLTLAHDLAHDLRSLAPLGRSNAPRDIAVVSGGVGFSF
jgi:hypothetical protein